MKIFLYDAENFEKIKTIEVDSFEEGYTKALEYIFNRPELSKKDIFYNFNPNYKKGEI